AVVQGTLMVNGTPAHESAISRDPAYPAPTSDVVAIVRRGAARPVSLLPLDRVRGDPDELRRSLEDSRDHIIVADALTDGDLDLLGAATLGSDVALAGSAGLARAVADVNQLAGAPPPLPRGRAWLVIAGSLHPATRAQIRQLETRGVTGERLDGTRD